jgi:ligand-binding sensor domain-containing protein/signal transduction histidine kinase
MKRCRAILYFAAAAFAGGTAFGAQEYIVDTWQVEDGLPQSSVTSVVQTRDGYLWAGTKDGLVRFDGVRFVVFDAGNTTAIRNSRIARMFEDRRGRLWIGTEGAGLVRLERERFTAFTMPNRGTAHNYARRLCDDAEGGLWVVSVERLLVRWLGDGFTVAATNWNLTGKAVSAVAGDLTGQVWVGTDQELAVWRDGTFQAVWGRAKEKGFRVEFLAPSRSGGCWVLANGRLRKFHAGQWVADLGAYAWTNREVYDLHEDHRGRVWVATMGDGLFRYDTNGKVLRLTRREGLPTDLIRCVAEDREHNVWVGTEGGGLCRLKPAIFQTYGKQEGLSSEQAQAVHEDDDGALWIGTNGDGLNRLKDGKVEQFGLEQGLANGHVWSVLRDRRGVVWAGTWGGLFRGERGQFVSVSDGVNIGGSVPALYEDTRGVLWVGQQTLGGLACWRDDHPVAVRLPGTAAGRDVRALAEDGRGSLWIGTSGDGLYRLKDGQFTRFGMPEGLGSEIIWCLLAEGDGTLWIGTLRGGLSRWRDGRISTCTTGDGLANNTICQIFDDRRGQLWLGSHGGVFRVRKEQLNRFADGLIPSVSCFVFTKADGLPSLECSGGFQPTGCQSRDGRLWFPTVNGLAVVDPARVSVNPLAPPVVIEEVTVNGLVVPLSGPTAQTERGRSDLKVTVKRAVGSTELRLAPGRYMVEIRFTGLSLAAPLKMHFQHQLEGLDPALVDSGPQRTVRYSYLPPGRYRFHVTACNNDGFWNEEGATLAITVLPHFWETGWFRFSMLSLLVGLSALAAWKVSSGRSRREIERLEHERMLERERTRIARDIHDDLGTHVTKIGKLTEQARDRDEAGESTQGPLREIGDTAREMVQAMDATVWAVDPHNDTLDQLAEYLLHYAEEFLGEAGVACRIDMPMHLPNWPLSAEVRHNLFLVVKEALNNVAKHAEATEANMELTLADARLCIIVQDNGRGFDPESPRTRGHGLKNMTRRVQEMGGRLAVESAPGGGTRVRLELEVGAK